MNFRRIVTFSLLLILGLGSCSRPTADSPVATPGSPFQPAPGGTSVQPTVFVPPVPSTPSFRLLPTRIPGSPIFSPTPDAVHFSLSPNTGPETYLVQPGDTLSAIAAFYGLTVESLMLANNITDPAMLSAGQTLTIPRPLPQAAGSPFKIIPDSELVYGPMSLTLDIDAFVRWKGGYLSTYVEDVNFETLTGAQIVRRVAQFYSVNPRLLLALLEYHSGWVTDPNPAPETLTEPLCVADGYHQGLYRQLTYTANALNRGYYLWRVDGVTMWALADGSVVPADPTINAGTAGIQSAFAIVDDTNTWLRDVSVDGFFKTYSDLFGYPFDLAIEPIVPADLVQPPMILPFETGISWAFTGGPHGGWDIGSAWAALDFAPSGTEGCVVSDAWVTAVADGLIVRTGYGAVVQDLDGDGYEQTGWTVLYMHIESRDRVPVGTHVRAGERIGHPSCEGGYADATHLHLARRFNGEWISADGSVPVNIGGWISSGTGIEYDGYLTSGARRVEAYNGTDAINEIWR
jgi:murein DD-endopeptidase MepM/ murein hydrolase activator NlpD